MGTSNNLKKEDFHPNKKLFQSFFFREILLRESQQRERLGR